MKTWSVRIYYRNKLDITFPSQGFQFEAKQIESEAVPQYCNFQQMFSLHIDIGTVKFPDRKAFEKYRYTIGKAHPCTL